jgi:Sulfotransferase family
LKAISFDDRTALNTPQQKDSKLLSFVAFYSPLFIVFHFTHHQMSTLNALSLNNTRRADNQIVIFNRVPKVGSQTFMELLRRKFGEKTFEKLFVKMFRNSMHRPCDQKQL